MTWATASQLDTHDWRTTKSNPSVDTLKKSNSEIQSAYETTLEGWSRALEVRDRETQGHSKRVTELTLRIAKQMGFSMKNNAHLISIVAYCCTTLANSASPMTSCTKKVHSPNKKCGIMRLHPQIAYGLNYTPIDYLRTSS
jgi:response regulator RpfG family c-di-GMP phosphodiesterase